MSQNSHGVSSKKVRSKPRKTAKRLAIKYAKKAEQKKAK